MLLTRFKWKKSVVAWIRIIWKDQLRERWWKN